MNKSYKECSSIDQAWDYIDSLGLDDYRDNERFAWADCPEEIIEYEKQQNRGCCGFLDIEIMINGRRALIGCNYGH